MNWNTHIENITEKANLTSAFMQRNLQLCPQRIKAVWYTMVVRPLLEYACTVWDPFTSVNIQKLGSVQLRSARFVMNDYRHTSSVTTMLNTPQCQPLAERTRCKAVMMYRIVNGLVTIPPLELHTTSSVARGHIAWFLVPYARTLTYRRARVAQWVG